MDELKKCPNCGGNIIKNNGTGERYCEDCKKRFVKRALCEVCGEELEKLSACGAQQFFCNKCKVLKSKKELDYFFREAEDEEKN